MKYARSLFSTSGIFLILIVVAAIAFYGCGNDQQKNDQAMDEMHTTNGNHIDEDHMDGQKTSKLGDEVVRKGIIDVDGVDENKDGFVYQDMMDWKVISDIEGKCPVCGMQLKKVNLEKTKENLVKHDYKVK